MVKHKQIEKIGLEDLNNWLASTGYLYPMNELQLERFNILHQDYNFKLTGTHIDVNSILNNTIKRSAKIIKINENNLVDDIENLRMVARNGKSKLPQHIVDKMRRKHNKNSDDL